MINIDFDTLRQTIFAVADEITDFVIDLTDKAEELVDVFNTEFEKAQQG